MKYVLFMFNRTAYASAPWIAEGVPCVSIDLEADEAASTPLDTYLARDLDAPGVLEEVVEAYDTPALIVSFPPCEDLTKSGACRWAAKRARDPRFQDRATARARLAEAWGERLGCAWIVENPPGALTRLWRRWNLKSDPWQYGAWIPQNEADHPDFPRFIPPRDRYNKETCYWIGGGLTPPAPRPVERPSGYAPQYRRLGGSGGARTKLIRSATPRGWSIAIMRANLGLIR